MTTQQLPCPTSPNPNPQIGPAIPESTLDQRYHEAYRLKLAGKPMQEIADLFNVDRSSIWRWIKQVEQEAINQLADRPVFNIIAEEVGRLTDLEEKAREQFERTKSDRAKIGYLGEARRAAVARQSLLVMVGVLPKQPEQIFRVTASMKPQEAKNEKEIVKSRQETIKELIDKMQKSAQL